MDTGGKNEVPPKGVWEHIYGGRGLFLLHNIRSHLKWLYKDSF